MITHISFADIAEQSLHAQDDRRQEMRAAFTANVALAILAVVLRLVSRRVIRARMEADDWTIIAALVVTLGEYGVSMFGLEVGCGRHVILLKHPATYAKVVLCCQCLYLGATWIVKTSILLLYRRLFGCKIRFNQVLWFVGGFVAVDQILQIFLSVFSCRPVNALWNPLVTGFCINVNLAAIIFGSINVVIDIVLLVLPIPLVWQLKIQMKWRLQLIGIFLLGGFVCLGSVYRTITLRNFAQADATWDDVDPAIWALVENSMGIVSACLPTMRPLFTLLAKGHRCSINTGHCETCARAQISRNPNLPSKTTTTRSSKPIFRTPVWSRKKSSHIDSGVQVPRKSFLKSCERGSKVTSNGKDDSNGTRDSDKTLVEQAPQTPPKDEESLKRVWSIGDILDLEEARSTHSKKRGGPVMEIF